MLHVLDNQRKLVSQNDYLEISIVPEQHLLFSDWRGWLDTNKGHEGCKSILQKVQQHNIQKIHNDNSKVTGHSGDTGWMSEVWIPALRAAGVTHFAWIYSYEFFTQLEIDNTVDKSTGIAMRTFFLAEDALGWLQSV
jgi:hypothetical protein